VIIVAHSAGCLVTVHWAVRHGGSGGSVRGALFATPPDLAEELRGGHVLPRTLDPAAEGDVVAVPLAVAHHVVGEVAGADSSGGVGGERGGVLAHSVLLGAGWWKRPEAGYRCWCRFRDAPPPLLNDQIGVG